MTVAIEIISRHICNIVIKRPSKRNALNLHTIKKFAAALESFEHDKDYKVAIISGAGGNFCAGYDLIELINVQDGQLNLHQINQMLWPLGTRLSQNKLTIAAIDGHAAGFGFELALKCDFRIAERDARLGFMNRRFGIPIMNGGTVILPQLIGLARAKELIATGKAQLAPEALEVGTVTHLCDIGCALGRSVNLARSLVKFPNGALMHDISQLVDQNSHHNHKLLEQERTNSLTFLETCGPLDNARKFLVGELGRHGSMDLGNLTKPTPEVTL